ncbi:MAG: HIT domain-containing protein [Methylobacteriaceae bacterium]|nr:HIT domain-containing protein [Methylobacteriaceae bacterium]
MPYDAGNIFARILRGELPSVTIHEDADTLSFMDIMPSVEGHTLVITKEPAEDIFSLSSGGAGALIRATQRVARAVRKGLDCPGVMLIQLNGAAAGQSVPHIHFHVLPRHAGLDLKLHGRAMVEAEKLEPVAAKIRAALE